MCVGRAGYRSCSAPSSVSRRDARGLDTADTQGTDESDPTCALTLGLNVVVAVAKVLYGTCSGSLALRADGFHSAAETLNNVVLLIGMTLAARPANRDHPYGHDKLELFSAALVGAVAQLSAPSPGFGVVAARGGASLAGVGR